MPSLPLETDYLIIGSGAAGMAFADSLFCESQATLVIVDRHHGPGGHWNDAYPFVRLHQPSSIYGVNSRKLGSDRLETDPLNPGLTERATGAEIVSYYEGLMQDMVASGRVQYFPMCHCDAASEDGAASRQFRSLLSGATTEVVVRKKIVDTTYLNTAVPSTHPPKYAVASGLQCMPLNNLPRLKQAPSGYVVVGAGKTGIDACLWLLANQVPPAQIRWIMPRDSWFLNRANIQIGDAFFMQSLGSMATQFEAVTQAESVPALFQMLENTQQLLRLDAAVEPRMYHAAVVSVAELEALRQIKDVIRLGRVLRFEADQIVLAHGTAPMDAGRVIVDCSASAAELRPAVPVFQGHTITLQFIQAFQPTFSAALIGHVEACYEDEALKNTLCRPVPLPDSPHSWLTMQAATMANRYVWSKDKGIAQWLLNARLDGFTKMMARVKPEEREKMAVMRRLGASVAPAAAKLKAWLAV